MADALSPIYELILPQVGASAGTWGAKVNKDIGDPAQTHNLDALVAVPHIQRQTLADGSVTMTVSAGTVAKMTVTQTTTIAFAGWAADTTPHKAAQRVVLQITGNGTHEVTFTGVTWLSGVTPSFIAATVFYVEIFTVDNGSTKYGVLHDRISTGAVIASMLAADSVTTVKILDANVTSAKLADDAVTSAKVAAAYPRRYKVHLSVDQSLPANTDTTISWASATTDYNIGTFVSDNNGIQPPASDTTSHYMELFGQLALQDAGDPSSDDQAVVKVWIEDNAGNILGESWVNTDAQNGNALGFRIQVRAPVDSPAQVVYRMRARSYFGAGTRNMLATKTWFAAVLY